MNRSLLLTIGFIFVYATSAATDLLKIDSNGLIQAQLRNVALTEISTFFKNNFDITFKGLNTCLQTKITVSFEKLTSEEVLKKVLSKNNYALTYNNKGKLMKVTLLPNKGDKTKLNLPNNTVDATYSKSTLKQSIESNEQNDSIADTLPSSNELLINQKIITVNDKDNITSFKMIPNAPPPGLNTNSGAENAYDITHFEIIQNAPPPGE